MFKKHINHKKIIACVLGVILGFAPVPALISAVTVYAQTDEEFEQSEVFQNWLGDRIADVGSHWVSYLFMSDFDLATLGTVAYAVSMQESWYQKLKHAVDADVEFNSDGAVYAGYYRIENNGQIYPGTISMHNSISASGTLVLHSQHFDMQIGFTSSNLNFNGSELRFSSEIVGSSIRYSASNSADYSCIAWWNDRNEYLSGTGKKTIQPNSSEPVFVVGFGTSSNIPVVSGSGSANGKTYLGSGGIPSLPELGSPMSYAKPWEYYNDLVDYLNQDTSLPTGIVAPKYDPDAVELPTSPHIGLNAEKGHLNDLNLDLEPYASGFDFWWWLTDSVLTDLHLRTVVLLLIALGSVGFIVWKVGR